ncbi:MFS transporter [Glycomyces xiaoerkulensis]|uniref:MFS transporter n=1 Tax=Glycomyces xiaoerkulensis TaxID=2038139 RepID=UPI000C25BE0E|nr:MFS transporter [Glycomyces xiaoerkulensis]
MTATSTPPDTSALQRRTLGVLFGSQVLGGLAVGIGVAVGALLIQDMTGSSTYAGLGQSLFVGGSALVVIPAVRITERLGRRGGLAFGYLCAVAGAAVVVAAIHIGSATLAVGGYFLLGSASYAGLQSRYAAADLSPPNRRGSHLSLILWATTLGSVTGPMLAAFANAAWVDWFGGRDYAGSMVAIGALCLVTAAFISALLRPDPLLAAREISGEAQAPKRSVADGMRMARRNIDVRTGVVAAALGHFVMVGVMAMTALHIRDGVPDLSEALSVVGVVIGLHIGAMYAFSPVFGRLADRFGPRAVLAFGVATLVAACATAGSAAVTDHVRITVGLVLLGIGWSAMTVSAATLVTGAVSPAERPSTQGFSDMVMGLAAMLSGIASGPIVEYLGYGMLNLACAAAALAVVPFLLRRRPVAAQ